MFDFQQPYDRKTVIAFLQNTLLPDDFVHNEESIQPEFAPQRAKKIFLLGKVPSLKLAIYEIRHDSENDPRVGLSRDAFRLLAGFGQSRAVVLFASKSANYRLSLVTVDLKEKAIKGTIREYSNPRRYSFFLGPDCKTHTPQQYLYKQVKDIDDLKSRFSIEVVNKEFYTQIAILFTKLVGGSRKLGSKSLEVKQGSLCLPQTNDDKIKKEFAVRLIGRLIFCWFLKKKKSSQGVPLIPEELLSSFSAGMCSKLGGYYHGVMEPLFFEVLNTPFDQRKVDYKKTPWDKIPFLNGGLFNPHYHDHYELFDTGVSKYITELKVPGDWLTELLIVFETYNFTIDENTPVDIELSIEPEMLGRIFENLLAEINPETGETARKSTGSYYTPRPIVEYMVDESLKQYLLTKTGLPEETLAGLLSYSEADGSDLNETQIDTIIDALHKIKIIDPACGSGAFPMGILQKILLVLQKLDPDSKKWLDKLLSGVPDPMYKKELKRKISQPNYLHKLGIIRDCIFGIDIQSIAVEISKLRFFLSLVVDEKVEDTAENRGIEHLPNLEFKFVCANSLVGLGGEMFLTEEAHKKIDKLKNIRDEYLRSYGPDKMELESQFTELKSELAEKSLNWSHGSETLLKLASWEPFKDISCSWFDPEWMFGLKSGFDIVIGNPPYLNVQLLPKEDKEFYSRAYSTFYKRFDIFGLFFELAYSRLAKKGAVTLIIPSQIFNNLSYKKLREVILKNRWLREVLYLGDKIFEAANNDVCVLFLDTNGVDKIRLVNALDFENRTITKVTPKHFEKYDYVISISSEKKGEVIFDKIFNPQNRHVKNDFDVFQGIVTGNNEVYILTQELIKENKIEKELLHPILLGRDFEKWYVRNTERQIIYVDGNTKIDKYPNTLRYLSQFEHELTHNKSADEKSTPWYCLHRPRVKSQLDLTPKILVQATRNPRLKTRILATIDEIGLYGTQGLNYIIPINKSASVYYLVGILNSSLINYLFTTKFLNVAIKAEYLKETPIPKANKEQEGKVISFVKRIFALTNNCHDYLDNTEKQAKVKELEERLDWLVYDLYGLTEEEKDIVENSAK